VVVPFVAIQTDVSAVSLNEPKWDSLHWS